MEKKFYQKWWFWLLVVVVIGGIAGAGSSMKQPEPIQQTDSQNTSQATQTTKSGKDHAPGETFAYDGLALVVSPEYSFDTINNQFSEYNGDTILVVPITVRNDSSDTKTLNMYAYKVYGSKGVELAKPSTYFLDDAVDFGGDLRPGAQYTKNIYAVYDGDGEYVIDFGFWGVDASVKFTVTK